MYFLIFKEQDRMNKNYRSFSSTEPNQASHNGVGSIYSEIYKGAASQIEESTPVKMENEEPVLDSVLAKYLDRDYWERKRSGKEVFSNCVKV